MVNPPRVYNCPTCGRPFDLDDKLFDFAIASHEKDHTVWRNSPGNLIALGEGGEWRCKLCQHPLGQHEQAARMAMITHAKQAHGSLPASPAPVTTGGGKAPRSGRGGKVIDIAEDVGEFIGDAVGGLLGAIGRALGD